MFQNNYTKISKPVTKILKNFLFSFLMVEKCVYCYLKLDDSDYYWNKCLFQISIILFKVKVSETLYAVTMQSGPNQRI